MAREENGREIMDQTRISVPLGLRRPDSLIDQVRRMIRNEMSQVAQATGTESFEEADDFDVDDDIELKSPYELDDEQERYREPVIQKPAAEKPVDKKKEKEVPPKGPKKPKSKVTPEDPDPDGDE